MHVPQSWYQKLTAPIDNPRVSSHPQCSRFTNRSDSAIRDGNGHLRRRAPMQNIDDSNMCKGKSIRWSILRRYRSRTEHDCSNKEEPIKVIHAGDYIQGLMEEANHLGVKSVNRISALGIR